MQYDPQRGGWRFEADGGARRETKVQRLLCTCGPRMTALYLKNRGYTAEQAITLMYRGR